MSEVLRDWEPGDGIRCWLARRAPVEMPCGRPVKTSVLTHNNVRTGERTVAHALCENHLPENRSVQPSRVRAKADRIARERVVAEHFEDYQRYLREAIDVLHDEPPR